MTCRAVAPMAKLSGWTLPLLDKGGRLVALKGRSAQEEIVKATKEISKTAVSIPAWWRPRSVRVWNRRMC